MEGYNKKDHELNTKLISRKNKPLNSLLELNILGYKYKYKDTYSTGYCYRCIFRSTCKLTIFLSYEEYNKLLNKELNIEEIKFTINSKQKQHNCTKTEIIQTTTDKILTKEEEYAFAVKLIKLHKDKKPIYHIENFKTNHINWPKNKIIRLVYDIQEEEYPLDKNYLSKLQEETIILGELETEGNKFFLCPRQIIINDLINKYKDHLIFITTVFQIKLIRECKYLFIDSTFRSSPKGYYQILNIIGNIKEKNLNIPILSVIMKTKKENSYYNIFETFKIMLNELKINVNFSEIYIMTDFEIGLRKAISKSFPEATLLGCYFHFVKNIFSKFKHLGLLNKKYFLKSYKILFYFKLLPFLYEKDQIELIKTIIDNFIINIKNKETKKLYYFILYFIKNWYGTNSVKYIELADNKLKFRTNNLAEKFHYLLNNIISHTHPKISYFLDKYKILLKDAYNMYIENIKKPDYDNNENSYIANDIMNFIIKITKKYKTDINAKLVNQLDKEDELNLLK